MKDLFANIINNQKKLLYCLLNHSILFIYCKPYLPKPDYIFYNAFTITFLNLSTEMEICICENGKASECSIKI